MTCKKIDKKEKNEKKSDKSVVKAYGFMFIMVKIRVIL